MNVRNGSPVPISNDGLGNRSKATRRPLITPRRVVPIEEEHRWGRNTTGVFSPSSGSSLAEPYEVTFSHLGRLSLAVSHWTINISAETFLAASTSPALTPSPHTPHPVCWRGRGGGGADSVRAWTHAVSLL